MGNSNSLLNTIRSRPDLSIFFSFVDEFPYLYDILKHGNPGNCYKLFITHFDITKTGVYFTILAPTNSAMKKWIIDYNLIPEAIDYERWEYEVPNNLMGAYEIRQILLSHFIRSDRKLDLCSPLPVYVSDTEKKLLPPELILMGNLDCDNGMIHIVDRVLIISKPNREFQFNF